MKIKERQPGVNSARGLYREIDLDYNAKQKAINAKRKLGALQGPA
jgi:hypothetical protein